MGGDYLLSINYPLILFFKIISGLSPLDFLKSTRCLITRTRTRRVRGEGGGGVNPLFTS